MDKEAEIKAKYSDCKNFFFFINQALKLRTGVKNYCILLNFLNVFTYSFEKLSQVLPKLEK